MRKTMSHDWKIERISATGSQCPVGNTIDQARRQEPLVGQGEDDRAFFNIGHISRTAA
jgi:hypothetical protein